jgi:hypothetical protein
MSSARTIHTILFFINQNPANLFVAACRRFNSTQNTENAKNQGRKKVWYRERHSHSPLFTVKPKMLSTSAKDTQKNTPKNKKSRNTQNPKCANKEKMIRLGTKQGNRCKTIDFLSFTVL